MASLTRLGLSLARLNFVKKGPVVSSVIMCRNEGHWNRDWKPGPYPRTAKEREAAAKKYGLRPEDYEPYPDDGTGFGDYPKLPLTSGAGRDPYQEWDYYHQKRNFGEPIHVDADILTEDRWAPDVKFPLTVPKMLGILFVFYGIIFSVYAYYQYHPYDHGKMPKQFPRDGVKHYTFEPAE